MLSAEELTGLRTETKKWYEDTMSIYAATETDDVYGGSGISEALLSSEIPCLVESGAAHEQVRVMMAHLQNVQLFMVTCPAETQVSVGNHLVITSRGNLHLRVQAVMAPESLEIERQVVASEEGEHH